MLMVIILPKTAISCKQSPEAAYYKTSLQNLEIQMQGLEDKLNYLVTNQKETEVAKKKEEGKQEQDDEAVVEEVLEEYYHDHPEERNLDSDYQSDYYGDYLEKEQIPFSKFRGTQQIQPGYDSKQ